MFRSRISKLLLASLVSAVGAQAAPQRGTDSQVAATAQQPDANAEIVASAHGLARRHLVKQYSAIGERLDISMQLNTPEPVPGWPGRWRFVGTATLRHYRDTESDAATRRRVVEIQETPDLSAKKKLRLIERTTFIRAETIAFEACITGTGADASLDFTLR